MARNLISLGIDDKDAVIPNLRNVGLLVREEVYIARRGEICNAPHLLKSLEINCKNHVRVINHNPAYAVADDHRLRNVAQLHSIGAVEYLVLHIARCGIVVRK